MSEEEIEKLTQEVEGDSTEEVELRSWMHD